MSLITEAHRFELKRAGFTDRQINTMAQKFYNQRNFSPFTTEEYDLIQEAASISRQREELLAAVEIAAQYESCMQKADREKFRAAIAKVKKP